MRAAAEVRLRYRPHTPYTDTPVTEEHVPRVRFGKATATLLALAVMVGAILAGCSARSPVPDQSETPLPESFTATGQSERPQPWWRHFNDRALDQVVSRVLDDNFSLAAARERLNRARAAARRAAGGERPAVDGEAEASSQTDYRAGAMAAYEVDLWGRLNARTEAAEVEADATRRDLQAARISLTAEAARTYYGLRREKALAALLREQRATNRRILDLVDLRYRNGQARTDELLRQRQLIEDTETRLAEVRGEINRLRAELAALQGLPGPRALELPDAGGLPELAPRPETGLPAEWLQRRPDLEAAYLRVQAADAELAAAIAERYPSLDLTASLETVASSPADLFQTWIEEIAASLSVPLFRGGRIEAEIDRTRAARAEAFNEYAQTVLDAVAGVETALADERSERDRLASLERRVNQGEEVLERLRFRYQQGDTAFVDVLRAQDELQNDQRERLVAQWNLVTARVTLLRELAGTWPPPESKTPSS